MYSAWVHLVWIVWTIVVTALQCMKSMSIIVSSSVFALLQYFRQFLAKKDAKLDMHIQDRASYRTIKAQNLTHYTASTKLTNYDAIHSFCNFL